MSILVTGSTGLAGNNIVRHLLDEGRPVRVIVREGSDPRPLEGLDVERVIGDIRDAASVAKACEGVEGVIHPAAHIHIGHKKLDEARAVNVDGTRHLAEAAKAVGVRMVHVSSVDTLAPGKPGEPADEETPGQKPTNTYVTTKRAAEQVVIDLINDGLDAVIIHPGFMLGPWDWKPSSGRMILEIVKRFTPMAPTGGISVCDVRDVARAMVTALDSAPTGRHYILAGENMSYFDAWKLFVKVGGGKPPFTKVKWLGRKLAGMTGDLIGKITGNEPDFNSAAIAASSVYHYYTSERAASELGYQSRPAEQAVRDAWDWFVEHGYA